MHRFRTARPAAPSTLAASLLLALAACSSTEPVTAPTDFRLLAAGTGVVYGQLLAAPPGGGMPSATSVPGLVVELGIWQGTPYTFRDSLTHDVAARPDDPRFKLLSQTTPDAQGGYRFAEVPKQVGLALRARPPAGTPYRVTYFPTLFGIGSTDSIRIPIVLRTP